LVLAPDLLARLQARLPEFAAIRRDIHRHPETGYEEFRTAGIVADKLRAYGLEVVTGLAGTGVVGLLRVGESERAVGIRADLDALDMEELNGFAHCSIHDGKMHGCGHDGHTAILLAAAEHLADCRTFDGCVYFIFQPAEEGKGGAQRMIDEGLFTRFPMQAVFSLHNLPGAPVGTFGVRPGPVMAGADRFEITIHGKGGHAAMPYLASDPVVATGAVIQALQTVLARNIDPVKAAVLSVTSVHGGSAFNVIPDRVELQGTVRYFEKDIQALMERRMAQIVTGVAEAHGCVAAFRYENLFPPTRNWPEQTAMCVEVLQALFGKEKVDTDPQPLMASEDFAHMLESTPGCYVWAGNGEGEGAYSVHNPRYDFNDELIPFGAAYWVRLVETALPPGAAT
jgi:hippurate hydrolase